MESDLGVGGRQRGRVAGFWQGAALGMGHGAEHGHQLGFMRSVAELLVTMHTDSAMTATEAAGVAVDADPASDPASVSVRLGSPGVRASRAPRLEAEASSLLQGISEFSLQVCWRLFLDSSGCFAWSRSLDAHTLIQLVPFSIPALQNDSSMKGRSRDVVAELQGLLGKFKLVLAHARQPGLPASTVAAESTPSALSSSGMSL